MILNCLPFLDFVLEQYVAQGVNELDSDKLPRLLELRYASVSERAAFNDTIELLPTARRGRPWFE